MAETDYYELLGVDRGADAAKLKSAFRAAALKFHPDRNPGDDAAELKFKHLNEAYQVLSDPEKRAQYDRVGHRAYEGGGGGQPGFEHGFTGGMSDIFEDIFGMMDGRRRAGPRRGSDLRYNLEILLEDAYSGRNVNIEVPSSDTCGTCSGTGARPGTGPTTCPNCKGAGRVRVSSGFFQVEQTCSVCRGRGVVIDDPCPTCHGAGEIQKKRVLAVSIPKGVDDGSRIRLPGVGERGSSGGPRGDLYVFISIAKHAVFERDGANLYCMVPITMVDAALGAEIKIPTITGDPKTINIPAGTQSGAQLLVKEQGMPARGTSRHGNLIVETKVEVAKSLSPKQKKALKDFDDLCTKKSYPLTGGFADKMRKLWDKMRRDG